MLQAISMLRFLISIFDQKDEMWSRKIRRKSCRCFVNETFLIIIENEKFFYTTDFL